MGQVVVTKREQRSNPKGFIGGWSLVKMKIAFDVDGVVLRSIEVILEHINRVKGTSHTVNELLSWELERLRIDEATVWDAVGYMYEQPSIEPYEGALQVLSRIYKRTGEPLLFITGRAWPQSALRQLQALPWNPGVPEMIVVGGTRDKRAYLAETSADFIVEDDCEYIREYLELGIGVGLMLQPWNRNTRIPVTERFKDWADLERWYAGLGHRDSEATPYGTAGSHKRG